MRNLTIFALIIIGSMLMGSCFWPYDEYYDVPPRGYVVTHHHHYERVPRHRAPAPPRHHRAPRRY
ncbi:MAG: hypothetical protein IKN22_00095 [Bacteroidaceae bacterium]|nr:hypothetical protein [Bacteroidaceae bacterium]MDO4950473.1 hypothetical protein [Bacteroidales bacterium]MBR3373373.1 hypothetical protein [Bacteroidaceae bacterium]MBR3633882.1 hypothetical protein [Bacteroidaceae bacterium]MBR3732916.1 hypothetical protein [Bacteroidaceae bacterium]